MGEITVTWKRRQPNAARDAINMYKKAATWARSRHIAQEGRPWFRLSIKFEW